MFGGMAGRHLPAEFRGCSGRVWHSCEPRSGGLDGRVHAGPRAFNWNRRGSDLSRGELSESGFVSHNRAACCDCRNSDVAAYYFFSVLLDGPSRGFASADGLGGSHARYGSAARFVRSAASVVCLDRKCRTAAGNRRGLSNRSRELIPDYLEMFLERVGRIRRATDSSSPPSHRRHLGSALPATEAWSACVVQFSFCA